MTWPDPAVFWLLTSALYCTGDPDGKKSPTRRTLTARQPALQRTWTQRGVGLIRRTFRTAAAPRSVLWRIVAPGNGRELRPI
jgi:hypothetical protein